MVKCEICNIEKKHSIVEHLKYSHNMTTIEYKNKFNDADVKSVDYKLNISKKTKQNWDKKDYRDKQTLIRNITHKDPEFKKMMSEKIKNKHKENPELFTGFTQWYKTENFKAWVISAERIKKISESTKKRWENNKYKEQTIKNIKLVLNDGRCNKNELYRENMSKKIAELYANGLISNQKNKYKTGIFNSKTNESFYYSSSYELNAMELFDNCCGIKKWTNKHGIRIPYYYNNLNRHYVPDFYIEFNNGNNFIIEMKGWNTEEVKIKEIYSKNIFQNYKIFFNINDLKKFIDENQ